MNIEQILKDAFARLTSDPVKAAALGAGLIDLAGPSLVALAAHTLPAGPLKQRATEHPDQFLQDARDLLAFIAQHPELSKAAAGQFGGKS